MVEHNCNLEVEISLKKNEVITIRSRIGSLPEGGGGGLTIQRG